MIQQDTIFDDIRRFSEQTALNTTFGQTDRELYWFALISCAIAIVAFIISIAALYYSIRTLKSQERTERNTRLIPEKERCDQLIMLMSKLFDNISTLMAILHLARETRFTKHPAPWHFDELLIDESLLTVDSFWDNPAISKQIVDFDIAIKHYNQFISNLRMRQEDPSINNSAKETAYLSAIRGTIVFYNDVLLFLNSHFLKYLAWEYYEDYRLDTVDIANAGDFRALIESDIINEQRFRYDYCLLVNDRGKTVIPENVNPEDYLRERDKWMIEKFFKKPTGFLGPALTTYDTLRKNLGIALSSNTSDGPMITMI